MSRTRIVPDASNGPADACAASSPSPADGGSESGVAQPPAGATEVGCPAEHHAGHLRDSTSSMFHFAAMTPAFKGIDHRAYKIYRDRLLDDCGGPTDPIEVMIIEQLSLAHFSLGLLSCKAANAVKVEAVGVYSGAAARLMGEFRRSALALQAYRAASRQLAAASTGTALVLSGESPDLDDDPEKIHKSAEMGSTRRDSDEEPPVIPMPRAASV
jgi:hypothetical protein